MTQSIKEWGSGTAERVLECGLQSQKIYPDPFNDVEVDAIFSKGGQSWRVPAFWSGGQRWTVRFAPPSPGEYTCRLQSTDVDNPDLNGREGRVSIESYRGCSELLRHGALRVSANGRHFEHADGTPFYWLGDTWWTGLSDRLSWEGFQELTADRKAKGFTLIQLVAGLVPPEELAPVDPGFSNEGGAVWEPGFERINPAYFDAADRRIQHLLSNGLLPAVVGGWRPVLAQMGLARMRQHWRYLIARYGAYPVLWILGGEVIDPPQAVLKHIPPEWRSMTAAGWTDVARYIRATDPYRHPLTVHEATGPWDTPLQDDSLVDFDMVQSGHFGWPSIATQVVQLNRHYARTPSTRPIVEGEIGYENLGGIHLQDFQRTAFWLSMLNGAAGHTYGANGTWESYTGDRPLHRIRHSFLSWEEGMAMPGSYQVGLGAKLLQQYPWWRFEPHPEWVSPRGTTLLDPCREAKGLDIGREVLESRVSDFKEALERGYPGGEWRARKGNFRLPYAAGIPGEVRFIYVPTQLSYLPAAPPTILGLEPGIRYRAYFWEPSLDMRIDLGIVARPSPGATLFRQSSLTCPDGPSSLTSTDETNLVASVDISDAASIGLLLRYRDDDHYIAAIWSRNENTLYLLERHAGTDGPALGKTLTSALPPGARLTIEVCGAHAAASVFDGARMYTTPIVDVSNTAAGKVGILCRNGGGNRRVHNFQLQRSPPRAFDETLQRELRDGRGALRGKLLGNDMQLEGSEVPGWSRFGRDKNLLLDAWRPQRMPSSGDWLLVLDAEGRR